MLNQVTLIGRLGADPEIRSTSNGNKCANLRIATTETWKDRNGDRQEKTEWHTVTIWSEGLVGVVERYVSKGSKIYVQGKLQTRKWQDRDGNDRYSTEVVLQGFDAKVILLDSKGEGGGSGGGSRSGGGSSGGYSGGSSGGGSNYDDLDDDIPFD